MYWNGYCGPDGSWLFHGPFFMFMLAVGLMVFFYIIIGYGKKEPVTGVIDTAQEILRKRYAAGEINEDEYLARKHNLEQ